MLNSTQAAEHVTESQYSKRTQAGIDLSVFKIERVGAINNETLPILLQEKTIIPKLLYSTVEPDATIEKDGVVISGWLLAPGIYSVTFNEGVKVPVDCQGKITHRSSLWRVGNLIETPWFDAGYECDTINSTLMVNTPMFIEPNARLCQIVFYRMEKPAEELYDGQWQGLNSATHQ